MVVVVVVVVVEVAIILRLDMGHEEGVEYSPRRSMA